MVSVLPSSMVDRGFIGGVMISVLPSSMVDRGSGQTKDYKIGICCFSAKPAELRRKSKDWLARNQDMSEWGDILGIYTRSVVSVSWHYKNPPKRVCLVQSASNIEK